jgi:hypothetical protein
MDIEDFLKQLNYTPAKARQEYTSLIQSIKSEKEIYLNCIDAALVKSDSLEYMHTRFLTYSFLPPGCSLGSHPILSKKMNYLKLFKEFILIDNNKVLPESINAIFYLKCGSKISADIIE